MNALSKQNSFVYRRLTIHLSHSRDYFATHIVCKTNYKVITSLKNTAVFLSVVPDDCIIIS